MECPWCGGCEIGNYLYCSDVSLDLKTCKRCEIVFPGPDQGKIDYAKYNKSALLRNNPQSSNLKCFFGQETEFIYLYKRLKKAIKHIGKDNFSILDIGAGPGGLLAKIKKQYPHAVLHGIEPSIHNVKMAREVHLIDLFSGYWEGQVNRKYDIITIFGSLMLHPDPKKSLLLAANHLKPNGILLFDFKNPKSATRLALSLLAKYLPDGLVKRKLLRQAFHGMPWGLAEKQVSELMKDSGLNILRINQLPGRNIEIGSKVSLLMRFSYLLDRLFNSQSWVEFMVCRPAGEESVYSKE